MKIQLLPYFLFIFQIATSQLSDFKHINLKKADSIAKSYTGEDLYSIPKLSYQLTKDLITDEEKFRSIFMWVSLNIKNDHQLYIKNKRKRRRFHSDSTKLEVWNRRLRKKMFQNLLKDKKTVCTGYAFLVKELSKYANIKVEIVDGYGRTGGSNEIDKKIPNHSWNAVKLNNKWYLCDATWASGIYKPDEQKFEFKFKEGYFLTDPELFVKNHFPLEERWTLLSENQVLYNDFLEYPLLYSAAFQYKFNSISPKKMNNIVSKGEKVQFEFTTNTTLKNPAVSLLIIKGKNQQMEFPSDVTLSTLKIAFSHTFNSKGYYDVHIFLNGEAIVTYTFQISN